jgi:hypothetical protein
MDQRKWLPESPGIPHLQLGLARRNGIPDDPQSQIPNKEVPEMRIATFPTTTNDTINPVEARWAADAIASLARQLDPESIVGVILKRSQRELASLVNCKNDESDSKPRMRFAA